MSRTDSQTTVWGYLAIFFFGSQDPVQIQHYRKIFATTKCSSTEIESILPRSLKQKWICTNIVSEMNMHQLCPDMYKELVLSHFVFHSLQQEQTMHIYPPPLFSYIIIILLWVTLKSNLCINVQIWIICSLWMLVCHVIWLVLKLTKDFHNYRFSGQFVRSVNLQQSCISMSLLPSQYNKSYYLRLPLEINSLMVGLF